jgi:hypothetical protein
MGNYCQVANLNGDGFPDIAVTESRVGSSGLLGAGGETFQPPVTYPFGLNEDIFVPYVPAISMRTGTSIWWPA